MSEIKALEKLRGCQYVIDDTWIREYEANIELCIESEGALCYGPGDNPVPPLVSADFIADEIQTEIDSRFMELPVDVNNEPVHIGDEMEHRSKHETLDVIAVGKDSFFTGHWADNYVRCIEVSAEWHHIKPRTLEDVLHDCCNEWNQHLGKDWEQGVYAKYADEIRELIGGDEE